MLSRTEKEQRVIELYQQGKTIREIAQDVHMSFGDIAFIIKKLTGLDDATKPKEQDKLPVTTLSKDQQAFALFSEGKKPTEVAIKLDLGADVVERLNQQFWRLKYELNLVYRDSALSSFILKFIQVNETAKNDE